MQPIISKVVTYAVVAPDGRSWVVEGTICLLRFRLLEEGIEVSLVDRGALHGTLEVLANISEELVDLSLPVEAQGVDRGQRTTKHRTRGPRREQRDNTT